MEKQLSKSKVINSEKINGIVVENNDKVLKILILNGLYIMEKDKIQNKNYIYYDREDEEIIKSNYSLNGFNLGYEKKQHNSFIDLENIEVKDFTEEDRQNFFDNLRRFNKNKIENNYFYLKNLNQISKSFDKYYDYKNIPIENCKVGDIFRDNLLNTKFFDKDNHLGLDNNFWMIVEVDDISKTYCAIHLEYLIVAQFDWVGKIIKLVNDIDSRFGKCNNGLPKSAVFNNYGSDSKNNKVLVSRSYPFEEVDKNHFFYDIKLVEKIELNDEQNEAISFYLIYKFNNLTFSCPKTRNWNFRALSNKLMTEFFGVVYLGYYEVIDSSEYKIAEPIFNHHVKEDFIIKDFKEKINTILSLLNDRRKDKNRVFCSKVNINNFINKDLKEETEQLMKEHYNKFFDKMIDRIPVMRQYHFKNNENKLQEFIDFINKKREATINDIMGVEIED